MTFEVGAGDVIGNKLFQVDMRRMCEVAKFASKSYHRTIMELRLKHGTCGMGLPPFYCIYNKRMVTIAISFPMDCRALMKRFAAWRKEKPQRLRCGALPVPSPDVIRKLSAEKINKSGACLQHPVHLCKMRRLYSYF